MESRRILFYDAKPYDRTSFEAANEKYHFTFKFLDNHLTEETALLAKGYDVICLFVNDQLSKTIAEILIGNGLQLVALRSAGYNNILLDVCFVGLAPILLIAAIFLRGVATLTFYS